MSQHRPYPVVHAAPIPGGAVTPCCGQIPTTLPRLHGITPNLTAVTCKARPHSPLAELVRTALARIPATGTPPGRPALPHTPSGHIYDPECAICVGDTKAIADAITRRLSRVIAASTARPATPDGQPPRTPKRARRPPAGGTP